MRIKKNSNEKINAEQEANEEVPAENEIPIKSENLEEKITSLEQEINQYKELALRKAAEFENYKRRTENDQLNLIKVCR